MYSSSQLSFITDKMLSGLGLHLQGLAQSLSESDELDLHEPCRCLASLGPYDHLQRLFVSAMCIQSEIFKNVMSMMTFASSCERCCVLGILIGMEPLKGFNEKGERLVLVRILVQRVQ